MATRKLLKSTAVAGSMTMLSRISGLARDVVFANVLGAGSGIVADAFYVAFRIPNFLRRIFAEGAFSQAFVPVLAEYRAKGSVAATREFLNHLTGWFGLVLLLVTVVGVLAAPLIVTLIAGGFRTKDPAMYPLTVEMTRIVFPYIFFISLVALSAGILNTYRRFGVAEFTSVLLNASLIAAALWFTGWFDPPVLALAWGVFIAGIVQVLFQLPFLKQLGLLPKPVWRGARRHEGVRRVVTLMIPAVFGASIAQINMMVNTLLASFLVTGSVSWLYYSDRLMEFPLGVFAIALATVILPSLAHQHAKRSSEEFSRLIDWALRWALFIGLPASVGLVVLAGPLITTIYFHGRFTPEDVEMSAAALTAFAAGLPALILIKVLAPGFYARQDTRTPMRIGVVAMTTNIALSIALVYPLKHIGLAAAISGAAFVNAGLLFLGLRRQGVYRPLVGWGMFLARITVACAAMGALLYWAAGDVGSWMQASVGERAYRLAIWVIAGIVVYIAATIILGVRPKELLVRRAPGMFSEDE